MSTDFAARSEPGFKMSDSVAIRSVKNSVFVFDRDQGQVYQINERGLAILQALNTVRSIDELVNVLPKGPANGPADVRAEVSDLLVKLTGAGLVVEFATRLESPRSVRK